MGRGAAMVDPGGGGNVQLEVPWAGMMLASVGDRVVPVRPVGPGRLRGGRAGSGDSGHEE
ncbi:hypothetical protein FAIPA1_540028 [Frankia sp. AiPs1]